MAGSRQLSFCFFSFSFQFTQLAMEAAVKKGDVKKFAELMRQDPGFNVNMDLGNGCTLLHDACRENQCSP